MQTRAFVRAALAASILLSFVLGHAPRAHAQAAAKLLITQVETRGSATSSTQTEYVVIRNPGAGTVDLSRYYLTDATFANGNQFYYNLPDAAKPIGGGGFTDFVARFPDGATLAPGAEISVSVNGSAAFERVYGTSPHFELYEDGVVADGIPDMTPAREGSILAPEQPSSTYPQLSNGGEAVILFFWDGASDLVVDVDYVVWENKTSAGIDKSAVSIDGPDADTTPTAYKADTPIASQNALPTSPTGTFIRADANEGTQVAAGGNGVGGRNETSENLATTFTSNTPGTPPGVEPTDTTPPTLVSASGAGGGVNIAVLFTEPVGASAGVAANYAVFPTANPGAPLAVVAAEPAANPAAVTLEVATPLTSAVNYTVRVSNVQDVAGNPIPANSTVAFSATGGGGGAFEVTGVFPFGPRHIGVAFSDKVNASQATSASSYGVQFGGSGAVPSGVTLQENQKTAILAFAADLPKSTSISVTVTGVTSTGGSTLPSGGPFAFSTGAETVVGIADIQADPASRDGQVVTIIGQVFLPVTVQGTQISGYLQDGTGRGLNLFGFTTTVPPAVDALGKVAKITGTVDVFNTTTEVTSFTAVLLAENQPHLGPKVLTVPQANSSQWEGTYIQTTATLTAAPVASGASNHNVAAEGDGSAITFRVRNNTNINFADFNAGDVVTGSGAGGAFQSTFQINVGVAAEFTKGGGGPDTTPPTLVGASGADAGRTISVAFSERVGTGATTAANYTIFPTATPAAPIAVNSASANGATVTLNLASALAGGTAYTVQVRNVQDEAGNPIASGAQISFTASGGGTTTFQIVGLFQFGPSQIGVAYSKEVNPDQAVATGNYVITPSGGAAAVTVQSAVLQDNRQTVILRTAAPLPLSATYGVAVSGVTSRAGDPLLPGGPASFTTSPQQVKGIDEIQANPTAFQDVSVTVIGQVFMPVTVQGSQISGYLQDGTGRGLNLFGFTTTVPSAVNAASKVVRVTGTIDVFFTTTELTDFTATLLADNQPLLGPRSLTVSQANSPQWEGTYIQTTATLTQAPAASGANNYNAPAEDGGASITFRIRNNTGINFASFRAGDRVTGAGAGAAFQTTFQINVGRAEDFHLAGSGPPTIVGAAGSAGTSTVKMTFSEVLERTSAETEANYLVFPTANPGQAIAVTQAAVDPSDGAVVTLSLASSLQIDVGYTVEVSNVQDAQGETIEAGSRASFTAKEPVLVKVRLTIPPVTLVKGLDGAGELIPILVEGEAGSRIVCRVVDLQGRVVRILADEALRAAASGDAQPSIELQWDGRDETYEFVPAGMYVCHVLATDLNGKVTRDQAPIVVAARLE